MYRLISSVCLYGLSHIVVAAEPATKQNSIHEMNTLVITASSRPEQLNDVLASVNVVEGSKLRQRLTQDLSDALEQQVGIQTQGLGLNRKGVSIRGMNPEHTLYLVDGQRINSSSSAIAHSDAELNWIPAEAIEQVEVVRGPMSSLYGSEALGGVINVITRKPLQRWQGSTTVQGQWYADQALGGEVYKTSAYVSGPLIEDQLGMNVWAEHRRQSALMDPQQPQRYLEDQQKNQRAHVGLFWQITAQQQAEVYAEYGQEQRHDLRVGQKQSYQVDDEIQRQRLGLKHTGEWAWGKSQLQIYESDFKRQSERSDGAEHTHQQLTDQVAHLQLQWDQANHELSMGQEWRQERLKDPTVNTQHEARISHYGMYLQDTWRWSDAIKIQWGLRADQHAEFGWAWSPNLNTAWQLHEDWTLKAGIGQGFKAPTLKQLSPEFESYAAMGGRGVIRGNPDLQPETNTAYELALDFTHSDFNMQIGVFENRVDDLIDTVRRAKCDVAAKVCLDYVNVAQAKLQGMEWQLRYPLADTWQFEHHYTYLNAKDQRTGEPLVDRAKHQFNTSVDWQLNDQLELQLRHQYRSRQYQGDEQYSKAYQLWHLYAQYQWHANLSLQTGIENLTNQQLGFSSDQLHSYSDAGRRYFFGIQTRF